MYTIITDLLLQWKCPQIPVKSQLNKGECDRKYLSDLNASKTSHRPTKPYFILLGLIYTSSSVLLNSYFITSYSTTHPFFIPPTTQPQWAGITLPLNLNFAHVCGGYTRAPAFYCMYSKTSKSGVQIHCSMYVGLHTYTSEYTRHMRDVCLNLMLDQRYNITANYIPCM